MSTFGVNPDDTTPKQYSFWGQSGWWTVPTQWYVRTDEDRQIWASPNSDFSAPEYACKTNVDGVLVFFDEYRNAIAGLSGPPPGIL